MAKVIPASKFNRFFIDIKKKKEVVLVGGCFDVLHPGHIVFLQKAKKIGKILVVMLESDQKVKILKGEDRPFNNQKERAQVLSAIKDVDYILLLPFLNTESDYDELIGSISPKFIAATMGDKNASLHKRSAEKTKAVLKFVTEMIGEYSTTRILNYKEHKLKY